MNSSTHSRPAALALASVLALSVVTLTPKLEAQSVGAGETMVAADEHAKRAQVAYDLQDWATAIREFQAAYHAEQRPVYLWGLAQAQRLSGDCAAANATYKAYRRNDLTQNQSTAAELQISRCEAEVAKKDAEAAIAARRALEATPPAAAPFSNESAAPLAPVRKASPKFYEDVLGDTFLALGVASVGVGTLFLLKGNTDMRAATGASTYVGYADNTDHASKEQLVGAIALGSGGALVTAAIIRYLTLGSPSDQRAGLTIGPSGCVWSGRF